MKRSGFTLIELLVVLMIMAVLAGAMVPMITANRVTAEQAKAKADMDSIKTAAMMYHYDCGTGNWPLGSAAAGGLQTDPGFITNVGTVAGWDGPYLDQWGLDPWGNNYRMIWSAAAAGSLTVTTYGKLNVVGGTGAALDISIPITSDRLK